MSQNFYSAYSTLTTLYGLTDIKEEDFEEIGLVAWNQIGNKRTKLYRYRANIDCNNDYTVELPCNVDQIEAVTFTWEDWNYVSNKTINGDYGSQFTEGYIEQRKWIKSPNYISGSFAKFEHVGDTLYFDRNYGPVNVLYKGIIVDEDTGLPEITDAEALAIATFVAYSVLQKEALLTRNKDTMQFAQVLQQDWLKRCSQARVGEYFSQNDLNEILDAKSSWNRKIFNKSFKPYK